MSTHCRHQRVGKKLVRVPPISLPTVGVISGFLGLRGVVRPSSRSWLGSTGLGRVGQRVGAGLRLRERDHLADVLLAGEDRDEAVDADGEARVRRRAEAERVEQEPEALLRVVGVDAEQREDALLDVGAVDTHRARAELPTVEHQVVRLRPHRQRVGLRADRCLRGAAS